MVKDRKAQSKHFILFRIGEEGAVLRIFLHVSKKSNLSYTDAYATKEVIQIADKRNRERNVKKILIRNKDAKWVRTHIPSSIWWKTVIHHDWKNGGIMYLLAPQKHKEITRKERASTNKE